MILQPPKQEPINYRIKIFEYVGPGIIEAEYYDRLNNICNENDIDVKLNFSFINKKYWNSYFDALIQIKFVPDERQLTVKETAHVLIGAVSLLIRSCTKEGSTITESQLMSEVIEHLNQEYISIDSFEDLTIDRDSLK